MSANGPVDEKWPLAVLGAWRRLLLPAVCSCCLEGTVEKDILCSPCRRQLPPPLAPCSRCLGHNLQSQLGCPTCTSLAPSPLSRVAIHEGSLRRLLLEAKWRHRDDLLGPLASALADRLRLDLVLEGEPVVVGVPRSWSRRWRHGSALSERLAPKVARLLGGTPLALLKQQPGVAQAGLSGGRRRSLKKGSFSVRPRALESLESRRVILIDDVLTTGATLKRATQALHSRGLEVLAAAVLSVSDGASG